MPKSLLAILKTPPKSKIVYPNQKGMTPKPSETGTKAFLKKLPIEKIDDPYDNDAFDADHYKQFDRTANRYGHDNVEFNDQPDRDATTRGKYEETDIVNESGPTKKHFQMVANIVRAIEDPQKRQELSDHHAAIFASQNPRFDHARWHAAAGTQNHMVKEGWAEDSAKRGKRYATSYVASYNTTAQGEPETAHDHGIKAVAKALFKTRTKYRGGGKDAYWGGGRPKVGSKGADMYTKEEAINELSRKTLGSYIKKSAVDQRTRTADIVDRNVASNTSKHGSIAARLKAQNKKDYRKVTNRITGINSAADKLSKEETIVSETKQDHDERKIRFLKRRQSDGDRKAAAELHARKKGKVEEMTFSQNREKFLSTGLKKDSSSQLAKQPVIKGKKKSLRTVIHPISGGVLLGVTP